MPDGKVSDSLDEAPAEPSIDPASGSAALSSLAWGNTAISEQGEPASSSTLCNPPAEPPMVSASEQAEPQALVAADQPPEPVAAEPLPRLQVHGVHATKDDGGGLLILLHVLPLLSVGRAIVDARSTDDSGDLGVLDLGSGR